MSEDDRRRWDERHAEADSDSDSDSNGDCDGDSDGPAERPAIFAAHLDAFPRAGHALELACGRGAHAVWLAQRGLDVLAVDVSPVAIEHARERAARAGVTDRCRFETWDLDQGLPPGPPADMLLCHFFRDPRLDDALTQRIAPGGLLAIAVLSEVGAKPGRFRARPGELLEAFASLERIADGEGNGQARLLARRPRITT